MQSLLQNILTIVAVSFIFITQLTAQFSCGTAIPINNGFTQAGITTTGGGGAADWVTTANTCGPLGGSYFTSGDVYLFSYTTSVANEIINFKIESYTGWMGVMAFTSCNGDVLDGCLSTEGYTSDTGRIAVGVGGGCSAGLAAGITVYFAVGVWDNTDALSFDVTEFSVGEDNPCGSVTSATDNCADAPLIDFTQPYIGSTDCCYTDVEEGQICGAFSIDNNSWIQFIASANSVDIDYDVTSCSNGDGIQIGIMEGSCNSFSTSFLCQNNVIGSGTFTLTGTTPGDTYYIMIDGWGGDLCDFAFTPGDGVVVTPPNDDCADAETIECGFIYSQSTQLATNNDAPTNCGSGASTSEGTWFVFTGDDSSVTLDVTNVGSTSFNPRINVYEGPCASLSCLPSGSTGNGSASVSFTANTGTDYYVYIDGSSGGQGVFDLDVSCATPCVEDAGTYTVAIDGVPMGSSCGTFDLPSGSEITWTSNGDQVIAVGALSGIVYSIFTTDPSGLDLTDPTSYASAQGDYDSVAPYTTEETSCGGLSGTIPSWPSTVWVVPHTADFAANPPTIDTDFDGCVSAGCITQINYVPLENVALGCGDTFTDPGGENGNYCNNETASWLICPDDPSTPVSVEFTSYSTEGGSFTCWDILTAYQGTAALAANEIDEYCSNNVPTTITSTDPSGCLFFTFTSDSSTTEAGWVANITCPTPPSPCDDPILIDCATAFGTNTLTLTNPPADPLAVDCGGITGSNPGVWYTFVGDGYDAFLTTDSDLTMFPTNFDTRLRVYEGDCSSLSCIGGNDDGTNITIPGASTFEFPTTIGTTYYVYIDGVGGAVGTVELVRLCIGCDVTPLSCNSIISSETLNINPLTYPPSDPDCFGGDSFLTGNWYSFTGTNQQFTLFTDNFSDDPRIQVYTSDNSADLCNSNLTCVTFNDDDPLGGLGAIVNFFASVGTTYYIFVDDANDDLGTFNLVSECCDAFLTDNTATGADYCFNTSPGPIATDAGWTNTGFDIGPNGLGVNEGVIFVEICDAAWDSATYPNPLDQPEATGSVASLGYSYNSGQANGTDGDGTDCGYMTLVPITTIGLDLGFYIIDDCFATGTPFLLLFRPEIVETANDTYDCGTNSITLTFDGGSNDDEAANSTSGEFTITGDISGTTISNSITFSNLTAGTINYMVTDPSGCSQTFSFTVPNCCTLPVITNPGVQTVCSSYTLPTIGGTDLTGSQGYYNDSQANGGTTLTGPITTTTTVWIYDGVSGCEDEESFLVTINPLTDPVFNLTTNYCSGATTDALPATDDNGVAGTWSPTTVSNTVGGTYTFTATAGCFNTYDLVVTIDAPTDPVFNLTTNYCSGATTDALPATDDNGVAGTWSPTTVSNTVGGTYTFTATTGCFNTYDLVVTIDAPTDPVFNLTTNYCSGATTDALPATDDNGVAGTWSPTTVSNTVGGTYTFTATAGCFNTYDLVVTIDAPTDPVFNLTTNYCSGATTDALPATDDNGVAGTWSPTTVSNTVGGTYTFTATTGCFNTYDLVVTIDAPTDPVFNLTTNYCSGATTDALPATDDNGVAGTWSPTTVSNTVGGTYTFTATAGCFNTYDLVVTIDAPTDPVFNLTTNYCSGATTDALPATDDNGVAGTWSPTTVSNTVGGTYTFTATAGCFNTYDLVVTIDAPTDPVFNLTTNYCSGATTDALPATDDNGVAGTWSPTTVSNTVGGTYTFTATAGCFNTYDLVVTIDAPTDPVFNLTTNYCSGATTDALPATDDNGVAGTWSPTTVSNTVGGTYTFTATAGCFNTYDLVVTIDAPTDPVFNLTTNYCSGATTDALPATDDNGVAGTWSPTTVSNTVGGTYTFTATAGCFNTYDLVVTIDAPTDPVFNLTTNYCSGATTDALPATDDNGVAGTWSPTTVSNTVGGTYTFTATAGCFNTYDLVVTIDAPTDPVFNLTTNYCSGATTDALPATDDNGVAGTWSPTTVSNTVGGTYTFTATAGCFNTYDLVVTIDAPTDPVFNLTTNYCSGATTDALPATDDNGVAGTWSPTTVSNTVGGTYTFTATAGCFNTYDLVVTIDAPTDPVFNLTTNYCSGATTDALPATDDNGVAGTWSPTTVSNTVGGTYTFTATAGCFNTYDLVVTIDAPTDPVFNLTTNYCSGATTDALPATDDNGVAGTWSPTTVSNTVGGTYTFTATAGCFNTYDLVVTIDAPTDPVFNLTTNYCSGATTDALPATDDNGVAGTWSPTTVSNTVGGTYTFTATAGCFNTYDLVVTIDAPTDPVFNLTTNYCSGATTDALPATDDNGVAGTWSPTTVSNTVGGTYTFTATAGCFNTYDLVVTIDAPTDPVFNLTTNYCSGATTDALPATDDNGVAGTWSPTTVSNTVGGTYTFTATAGCFNTYDLVVTIDAPTDPVFNLTTNYCSGATTDALPATDDNGVAGTWSPATVSNTVGGTYTFTATAGCFNTYDLVVTIDAPTDPVFNLTTNYCSGATTDALPATDDNGVAGTWSPTTVSNTVGGTYTFTATAGCFNTYDLVVTIDAPTDPVFNLTTNYCSGATTDALPATDDNGVAGTWSPTTVSNTVGGTYTFTATAGCFNTYDLVVTIDAPTDPVFNLTTNYCSGATTDALPATDDNGVAGMWSPTTVSNTVGGTYTFTATAGCFNTYDLVVTIDAPTDPVFNLTTNYCSGATTDALPATDDNGVAGTWSPTTVSNTVGGTYTFTATAGCFNTYDLVVTIDAPTDPVFNLTTNYCSGATTDALPATDDNGVAGTWSPTTVSNTVGGTYTFTATAGCFNTYDLVVTIDAPTDPVFNLTTNYCSGATTDALPATDDNGVAGMWSPTTVSNTVGGTYTFTATAGCFNTYDLVVTIDAPTDPVFNLTTNYCSGATTDALPATDDNGVAGTWSPTTVSNTVGGTYTFTATAGCFNTYDLVVTIDAPTDPVFNLTTNYCSGATTDALPATDDNGVAGTWSPATVSNTVGGTYTFTATAGCFNTYDLVVTIDAPITPIFAAVGSYCTGTTIPALPTISTNLIAGTWSPAIDNTTTTTYTFTPDAGECATNTTLEIVIDAPTTPTFTAVGPYCSGATIPALPINSTNTIAGTWTPAINNTVTTTYTFTPAAGECATITTLEIVIEDAVLPTFAAVGPYCSGAIIPALATTSTNSIVGTWSPTINNLATTTYTFTPAANECATPTTLEIVIDAPVTPTFAGVGPYCSGDVIPVLPTTSINSIVGTWSPAINNTATTTYTFMPDAAECATMTTLEIVIENAILPTFAAVDSYCSGEVIPVLLTTSTNVITGTWSPAINNTATTTYTFTPAANECAIPTTLEIEIDVPTTPMFDAVDPYCTGDVIPDLPTSSTNGINGTWSPAINNAATTTYTFQPNADECAMIATLEIIVNPEVTMVFNTLSTTPYCIDDVPQLLPVQDDNGEMGTWNIPTISTTTAGTTTYTFTPNNVCGLPFDLSITVEDCQCEFPATVNISPITSVCETEAVSLTANIGGTATTVTWTSNGNGTFDDDTSLTPIYTLDANEITAGLVEFTVETNDPDGADLCTTAISTVTVLIDSEITPSFDPVDSYCSGTIIPALPIISTNSITGTWSPAINNTATTTYTFTPAASECAAMTTLEIVIDPATTPSFDAVGSYCSGEIIPALPTTSTNSIVGTWSPAINNTATTTYTFTPGANECATTTTLEIIIEEPTSPTFTAVGPYCSGAIIPDLLTTSINGINGSWSPAINNLATTNYTFTPDNGECAIDVSMEVEITSPITPTFTAVGPYCIGEAIPVLPTTSMNGIDGTWLPIIDNTATTTYTFTPDAGQCGTMTTLTIEVRNEELPTFTSVGPYCSGDNIPSLPVISLNSITGTWSPAINNIATTTYTFTPANTECAMTTTLEIIVNTEVTMVFNTLSTTPYCIDDVPQLLPVQDDNGEMGTWNIPTINTATAGTTTYTFTPENVCGLPFDLSITVEDCQCEIPATVNISPITSVCETETVSLTANIGGTATTVTWTSNGNGTFDDDTSLTPTYTLGANDIAAGTVEFTVETNDPDGADLCTTAISTVTVLIDNEIEPMFDAVGPYCAGTTIPALATTSTNSVVGTWSPAINNATTTVYTFTPDAGQCASTQTMTIVVDPLVLMDFTIDPTTYCIDDIPNILPATDNNGEGGTWLPNTINTSIVGTSTYTFTPTAACGQAFDVEIIVEDCDCEFPATVDINPVLPVCETETISLTANIGGTATTVTWTSNGNGTFDDDTSLTPTYTLGANDIAAGTVEFTVETNDPDGADLCTTAISTVTVLIDNEIEPMFDAVGPYCAGTTIPALATTSTNSVVGTWSPAINNATTTVYTFTPDAGQCASTQTMTIVVDPLVLMDFTIDPTTYCIDDIPNILPATDNNGEGGTWLPNTINTSVAGTSTYTFTPTAACGQAFDVEIIVEDCDCEFPATVDINPVLPVCETETISLTANIGGTATTVTWTSNGNGTFDDDTSLTPTYTLGANDIAAGTVEFTVETNDPDGADLCTTAISTVTVLIDNEIEPMFDAVGPYCAGTTIPALATTSTNSVVGTWSPAINNATTTVYTFTPDAGQCASTQTMTIVVDPLVLMDFTIDPTTYCIDDIPNILPATDNNGEGGTWLPNTINTSVAGTSTYTFTPTAACGQAFDVEIIVEDCDCEFPATVDINPVLPVCETETISLTANIGGTATTVTWTSNGNGTFDDDTSLTPTYTLGANDIAAGTVEFTVETNDPDGADLCTTAISTVTVLIDNEIEPMFDAVGPYCAGTTIPALATTSTNSVVGTWSPAINNATTTVYTFTPDAGQCASTQTMTIVVDPLVLMDFTIDPTTYCIDDIPNILPATDNNGEGGTWLPNTINTSIVGTSTYTFTPTAACGQAFDVEIIVEDCDCEFPATVDINPVLPVCETETISLTANIGGTATTVTWTSNGNGTFDDDTSLTPTYTLGANDIAAGTVEFTVETNDPDGADLCTTAISTVTVLIDNEIEPMFDAVGPYCAGTTIPALATTSTNSVVGTWSPAINNATTTVYTFTPDAGQCASTQTMTIVVDPLVLMDFTIDPTTYCIDDIPNILPATDNNGEGGTWLPNTINTSVAGTSTYTFTPTAACGQAFDVEIIVEDCDCANEATISINPILPICAGETIELTAILGGSANIVTWSSTSDDTFSDLNATTTIYTPSAADIAAGSVVLRATTDDPDGADECLAAVSEITLIINMNPTIDCSSPTPTSAPGMNDGTIMLDLSGGGMPYAQILLVGNAVGNVPVVVGASPMIIGNLAADTYEVTLIDANGCSDNCMFIIPELNCTISTSNIVEGACNNQGTLADPNDDTYEVTLDVMVVDGGTEVLVTNNVNTDEWGPFPYGTITIDNLPANGMDIILTFEDTNTGGCTNTITVSEMPCSSCSLTADAGNDQIISCASSNVTLSGNSNEAGVDYLWTGPLGFVDVMTQNTMTDIAGWYYLNVSNIGTGCTAIDSVFVDVSADIPTANAIVSNELTCDILEATITGTSNIAGATFAWTGPNNEPYVGELITVTEAGIYTLIVTNPANNCTSPPTGFEVIGNYNEPIAVIQDVTDVLNCATIATGITLDGTGSSIGDTIQYIWTLDDAVIGNDITQQIFGEGEYIFTVVNLLNNCVDITSVNIQEDIAYPVADAGLDTEITCIEMTATLDGTNSDDFVNIVYSWEGPLGATIENDMTNMPTVDLSGEYIITVVDTSNMCTNMDTVLVNDNTTLPIVVINGGFTIDCILLNGTLDGTGSSAGNNFIYQWSNTAGNLNGQTDLELDVNIPDTYTLEVTNTLTGCVNDASEVVNEDLTGVPVPTFIADSPTCFGDNDGSISLDTIIGGEAPYLFSFEGQSFTSSSSFNNLSAGNYSIIVEDAIGCQDEFNFMVTDGNDLMLELGDNQLISLGDNVELQAEVNISSFEVDTIFWTTDTTTLSCIDCYEPTATPFQTTTYSAQVIDENGCTAEDFLTIIVNRNLNIYVPTAFSPDGDGVNDVLTIYSGEQVVKVNSFLVFDRWGEKVYEYFNFPTNDETYGWDGLKDLQLMNMQVFAYHIEVELVDGTTETVKGDFTLIR